LKESEEGKGKESADVFASILPTVCGGERSGEEEKEEEDNKEKAKVENLFALTGGDFGFTQISICCFGDSGGSAVLALHTF